MASSIFFASPILLIILFHLLLSTEPTYSVRIPTRRTHTGFRVTLTRVSSGKTSPKYQSTVNELNNVRNEPKRGPITSPMKAIKDIYNMRLAIGTPPVTFTAIMDTGSDLIWTKCQQNFPGFFDSSKSSTFSKVNDSCESFQLDDCKQKYADGNSVSVDLGQETLTFGAEKIPDVIFACGTPSNKTSDGIVGMGRGKLSLVSQLKELVFAYCLGSRLEPSETSVLLTGSKARSAFAKSDIQTMPLITPDINTSYYYISLEGISLGEAKLPVKKSDFAISNGDGGMIIDSGTTFMYLENSIVNIISNEFMNQTKLEKLKDHQPYDTLEHCFKSLTHVDIPKLVFHFEGANWELPKENYIYEKNGVSCLAIIANPDNEKVSIFGNLQQQNMMILYDLGKNTLSFKPANCKEL